MTLHVKVFVNLQSRSHKAVIYAPRLTTVDAEVLSIFIPYLKS